MSKYVYLDEMFTEDEFNDLVIAVESKISSMLQRRERYGFIAADPRYDDPEFQHNAAMMWSDRDEERLQCLSGILADLLVASANIVCTVNDAAEDQDAEPAEEAEEDPVLVVDLELMQECHSVACCYSVELSSQLAVAEKMRGACPSFLRGEMDKQYEEKQARFNEVIDLRNRLSNLIVVSSA